MTHEQAMKGLASAEHRRLEAEAHVDRFMRYLSGENILVAKEEGRRRFMADQERRKK